MCCPTRRDSFSRMACSQEIGCKVKHFILIISHLTAVFFVSSLKNGSRNIYFDFFGVKCRRFMKIIHYFSVTLQPISK